MFLTYKKSSKAIYDLFNIIFHFLYKNSYIGPDKSYFFYTIKNKEPRHFYIFAQLFILLIKNH